MSLETQSVSPTPEWFELKGRLFRFFGTHQGWTRWQDPKGADPSAWICGPDRLRDREPAQAARVAAILKDPRLIPSRSMPERRDYTQTASAGWDRMLSGVFTYLAGPALLDDTASISGALLQVPGAAKMPTGSPVSFPEPSAEHVGYEQMDALFEQTLSEQDRNAIAAHVASCPFCARQVAAYEGAAAHVGAPIARPKRVSEA